MQNHAVCRLLLCLVAQSVCVRAFIVGGEGYFMPSPISPSAPAAALQFRVPFALRASRISLNSYFALTDATEREREAHACRSPVRRDPATWEPRTSGRILHQNNMPLLICDPFCNSGSPIFGRIGIPNEDAVCIILTSLRNPLLRGLAAPILHVALPAYA